MNGEHQHWLHQWLTLAEITLKTPLLVVIVHWWPTPVCVRRILDVTIWLPVAL